MPNNQLYYLLRSEEGDSFDITGYVTLMSPILAGKQSLKLSQSEFTRIERFILPDDWSSKKNVALEYFSSGVQKAAIDDELIVIKQLSHRGYLVYKDDESGLLVLQKKR